jgi:phenylalanine-4-hydroxylase
MADDGSFLPPHLARYVVPQDYESYTPRDQAVWRHILRRLTAHLQGRAHPSYLKGLEAAGIGVESIPSLEDMNGRLGRIGWRAVGVRGFIPPAVFTEMQALGVLAIAADIRTHEHIDYTPAPDIVHESAGHAPILADPKYAEYVRRCGVVGFKAIASREDQAVYDAIRNLSVVKEDPASTPEDEVAAHARLEAAQAARTYVSESTRASRLYWWTAEYGLVGTLEDPRIYGAGLLSSLGEAEHCLTPAVAKLPLSLACVDREFDITTMQPQLYVARDFDHLFEVLEAFEATLSWRTGGRRGLEEALRAGTVNHAVLESGLEVTGRVVALEADLAILEGPIMVSLRGQVQGPPWPGHALIALGGEEPDQYGPFSLELPGGVELSGLRLEGGEVVDLEGYLDGRDLGLPARALLFTSGTLPSVAGGPGDPEAWDRHFGGRPDAEGEGERLARQRKANALPPALGALYREVRCMRLRGAPDPARLLDIRKELAAYPGDWLLAEEVEELLGSHRTQESVGAAPGPRNTERP